MSQYLSPGGASNAPTSRSHETGGQAHLMQRVSVVAQSHAQVGLDVLQLDQLVVEVHDILALRLHLDQDLLLAHQLDHLTNVRPGLM